MYFLGTLKLRTVGVCLLVKSIPPCREGMSFSKNHTPLLQGGVPFTKRHTPPPGRKGLVLSKKHTLKIRKFGKSEQNPAARGVCLLKKHTPPCRGYAF